MTAGARRWPAGSPSTAIPCCCPTCTPARRRAPTRTTPLPSPGRAGGIADEQLIGDVGGAATHLRRLPTSNGKVAVIGHCSGGRQAVLAGCNLDLQGVVDCYGAYVIGTPVAEFPVQAGGLEDQLAKLSCPLLGLFGAEDSYPSPDQVAELGRLLTEHGKEHELHTYDGAGHGFFCTDRPAYRPTQAMDGYSKIAAFFARTIGDS
jgi:carboxymethylenebutenolidase